ncbi:peptidase U32 family protein [Celerinatantimonas sp. MCCC 1A17872]|uniref:peptidase U32 family protein n=1 Tax=Celerinatantimonas sp. MCCC 1A17872 TaxID=3177514 RepID=UPI0038CB1DF9
MSRSQFELLAPGGDLESIKAAIVAGADAIYCGLERFNARSRASNLSLDELKVITTMAHHYDCKIFLTLNIILLESEIRAVVRLLNKLVHTNIDGIIIQDLGLGYILKHYFPMLDVHASTQLNTHNEGQIEFLANLGVSRVNLSRELDLAQIRELSQYAKQRKVLTEVFIHGSHCIGFSGLCYISSERNGASGNRGRCSQPCRDPYQMTEAGANFPLNLKDISVFDKFAELAKAGVYSLKVEGRMKQSHYVYTVVQKWREQIDSFEANEPLNHDLTPLYQVFNRDFSAGYLDGEISRQMYIDDPRNHAPVHFAKQADAITLDEKQLIKRQVYDENTQIIQTMKMRIQELEQRQYESEPSRYKTADIRVPVIKRDYTKEIASPKLNILISKPEEIETYADIDAALYYQLPSALQSSVEALIELFTSHVWLIPWFPAVLMAQDYSAAKRFLTKVHPALIVSDNAGVGMLAKTLGIDWIAGPQLNLSNAYALICLKQEYGCCGGFISGEISARQMKTIAAPNEFRLCFHLFHPLNLLTSRQCLFQQTVGCRKKQVTRSCLPRCEKHAEIINLNTQAYIIDKQLGEHNSLYHPYHYLNLELFDEVENLYSDLFIDLRAIQTQTQFGVDKHEIARQFVAFCEKSTRDSARGALAKEIEPTTHQQFTNGL